MSLQIKTVSWLEKVFLNKEPSLCIEQDALFENERYSFQVAVYFAESWFQECTIAVESPIKEHIRLYRVGQVPVQNTVYATADDYYLSKEAGLFPDPLMPMTENRAYAFTANVWHAFFITVEGAPVGRYPIRFVVYSLLGEMLGEVTFTVEVLGKRLPENPLIFTNWVHFDCLCEAHGVEPFTPDFYTLFDRYIQNYVRLGNTMLLTPIFTPPLDTEVGGERMTVQLVDVAKEGGRYAFSFKKLEEFIDRARGLGIKHFEISHLFTQWGARACPKIMATVEGEYRRIFGWDTPADGEEYFVFLRTFLPALVAFLKGKKVSAFFHLSDEPNCNCVAHYEKLKRFIEPLLDDFPMIDALSDFDYYKRGLVDIPVVALDHVDPFLQNAQGAFWVYYCNGQNKEYLSNRLIAMPSLRTAILGAQLYQTKVQGFLQWGHNFYHSFLSRDILNPFLSTDSMGAFPAGDGFIVYPNEREGAPINSLRGEALYNGVQCYLLLLRAEKSKGRAYCERLLCEFGLDGFTVYPHDERAYLRLIATLKRI